MIDFGEIKFIIYMSVPAVIMAGVLTYCLIKYLYPELKKIDLYTHELLNGIYFLIIIVFMVHGFFFYLSYRINFVFGFIHSNIVILCLVAFIYSIVKRNFKKLFIPALSILVPILLLIVFTPIFIDIVHKGKETREKTIEIKKVTESLDKIKSNIKKIDSIDNIKPTEIERLYLSVLEEIEKAESQLRTSKKELGDILKELEYYKQLVSLNEKQTNAIFEALNRRKYIDYLAGILNGFVASGFFYFYGTFRRKKMSLRK